MTDVRVYATNDDGEVNITPGGIETTDGLETAVYISLFGANERDSGRDGDPYAWWGDADEDERSLASRTQHVILSAPPTPSSLRRVKAAAEQDLAWLVDEGVADSVEVFARIPGPKRVELSVDVAVMGDVRGLTLHSDWGNNT